MFHPHLKYRLRNWHYREDSRKMYRSRT